MATEIWEPLPPCSDCTEIVAQLNRRMPQIFQAQAEKVIYTQELHPDPHPETTTVDGHCVTTNLGGSDWGDLHNGAGSAASDEAVTITPQIRCDAIVDKWDSVKRGIATFDLSTIPDLATIVSVEFKFYQNDTTPDDFFGGTSLVIVSATTASDTAIAASDFTGFGTTELAERIPFTTIGIVGANSVPLNKDGVDFVKSHLGGIVKLGLYISYDFDDDEPPWTNGVEASLDIASSENTNYQPPTLVVKYSE